MLTEPSEICFWVGWRASSSHAAWHFGLRPFSPAGWATGAVISNRSWSSHWFESFSCQKPGSRGCRTTCRTPREPLASTASCSALDSTRKLVFRAGPSVPFPSDVIGWCHRVAPGRLGSAGAAAQREEQHYPLGLIIFSADTFLQLYTHFGTICKQRSTPHLQKDKRRLIAISIY